MLESTHQLVQQRLVNLVDRGVFQCLKEIQGQAGKTNYRFSWLLGLKFELEYIPGKNQFVMKNILPGIINRSYIDGELRKFFRRKEKESSEPHRRIDPQQAALIYVNRKQSVSLTMKIHDNNPSLALTNLLRVVNELFSYLNLYHVDYLQQQFGLEEE